MASVELTSITKKFGAVDVIRGLDLHVEDGSFCALLGPSGCGKSTLLRMIAGLETVTAGNVQIGGVDVTTEVPAKRRVAMVFQSYALYPHLSVEKNICFSLSLAGVSKAAQKEQGGRVAKLLQLEELMARRPAELSGGQRQRVAIGRALVRNPEVFLFDEPLSNLDALLRVQMRLELAKLHNELKTTMIYVTHDQVEAMTLADKIVVLRDGLVQQIGAPMDLYHNPSNLFVAGFLGAPSMNFINVTVKALQGDKLLVTAPGLNDIQVSGKRGPFTVGQTAILGLRPQYLSVTDDTGIGKLQGKVALSERLGSETVLELTQASGQPIIATLARDAQFQVGTEINLSFDPDQTHLFQPDASFTKNAH